MPSSHAAIALGSLTLYLGNAALQSVPRQSSTSLLAPSYFKLLTVSNSVPTSINTFGRRSTAFGARIWRRCRNFRLELLNFLDNRFDEPDSRNFCIDGIWWLVTMIPVPH